MGFEKGKRKVSKKNRISFFFVLKEKGRFLLCCSSCDDGTHCSICVVRQQQRRRQWPSNPLGEVSRIPQKLFRAVPSLFKPRKKIGRGRACGGKKKNRNGMCNAEGFTPGRSCGTPTESGLHCCWVCNHSPGTQSGAGKLLCNARQARKSRE